MNKHVQIREVPEKVHRTLKARAAEEGMSISDFLKRMIERELRRPGWAEMTKRMDALKPIALSESTADMVRRERDSR